MNEDRNPGERKERSEKNRQIYGARYPETDQGFRRLSPVVEYQKIEKSLSTLSISHWKL